MTSSSDIHSELIDAAQQNPPTTYLIPTANHYLLNTFEQAFEDNSKYKSIIDDANNKANANIGLIIFGYKNQTSLTPITDLLDKVDGLNYGTVDLADGRKLGFMSHKAARTFLPLPNDIENNREDKIFNKDLIVALKAIINAKVIAKITPPAIELVDPLAQVVTVEIKPDLKVKS